MQKYNKIHTLGKKPIKKPITILKVLSALFFFLTTTYICFRDFQVEHAKIQYIQK